MQSLRNCCRQKNERGEKYLPQERQNVVNPGSCSSSPAIWRRRFAQSASMKCKISVPTTSSNATSSVAQMVSAKAEVRASFARRFEERASVREASPLCIPRQRARNQDASTVLIGRIGLIGLIHETSPRRSNGGLRWDGRLARHCDLDISQIGLKSGLSSRRERRGKRKRFASCIGR